MFCPYCVWLAFDAIDESLYFTLNVGPLVCSLDIKLVFDELFHQSLVLPPPYTAQNGLTGCMIQCLIQQRFWSVSHVPGPVLGFV